MVQKKSLTVPELVKEIKKFKAGMTATAIMSALRKRYTFAKDKWNLARKSIAFTTKSAKKITCKKTTKKRTNKK